MIHYSGLSRNYWAFFIFLLFVTIVVENDSMRKTARLRNGIDSLTDKVPVNKHAEQFIASYIQTNKAGLSRIRERSPLPFYMIDTVFIKYDLPVQLKYLAVIESELKTNAVSRVGAVGPWQLMPATAQLLGLKVSASYDERTNYYKSTKAVALYLRDLYSEFGDWLLVIAAYNSGPGPVYKAIRQSGSRNFWALQNYLPAESRIHVKKFIAAHYYFEQQGSVTTYTKAEWQAYNDALAIAGS
jgi:membrane-bound lytic murein transglycosylase D